MGTPFDPVAIAGRFVAHILSLDPDLAGVAIYPRIAPSTASSPHATQQNAGPDGGVVAESQGRGVAMVTLRWSLIFWQTGYSNAIIWPLSEKAMAAIVGDDMRGRNLVYTEDDGRSWNMTTSYAGPVAIPVDATSGPSVWQPLGNYYTINMVPRDA